METFIPSVWVSILRILGWSKGKGSQCISVGDFALGCYRECILSDYCASLSDILGGKKNTEICEWQLGTVSAVKKKDVLK